MSTIVLPSAFPEVCARGSCLLLLFVSNLRAVFLCDPTDIWSPDAGWCFDVSNCTMLDGMYKVHDSIKLSVACKVRISLQTGFRRGGGMLAKKDPPPFSLSQFTHVCYRVFREYLKLRYWIDERESARVSLKRKLCILLKAVLQLKNSWEWLLWRQTENSALLLEQLFHPPLFSSKVTKQKEPKKL